jgi:hypothetical protein
MSTTINKNMTKIKNPDNSAYRGNTLLKKPGTQIEWTQEMVEEYLKCKNDPIYFIKKYIKVIHVDRGLVPLDLYEYQEDIITKAYNHRNVIVCASRQCGKTTSIVGFVIHYIIFNSDKDIGILANKGSTSRKILASIKLAYTYLPKFLQSGVVEWNKGTVVLENNCRIIAESTSADAVRSWSFSVILIDEAAHIKDWESFSASVLPTISSGETTKLIYLSTPHGLNHFFKTWQEAVEGRNNFQRVEVPWYKVKGRDEKWKQKTLSDLNFDMEKFEQEYACAFVGSSGSLISGAKLKALVHRTPIAQKDGLFQYELPIKGNSYVMVCDVSEGKGLDYSTIQVLNTTEMPYKQVCVFKSNMITPTDFAAKIFFVGKLYNDASCLIEINSIGETVSYILHNEYEYPNILRTENAGRLGKKITHKMGKNIDNGIRMTITSKATGCSLLKLIVESDQLIINDHETIEELSRFSRKGRSYEAESGYNDDLVTPLIGFAWLTDQKYFKEYTDINTVASIRETTEQENIQIMLMFGYPQEVTDGREPEKLFEQGLIWSVH